MTTGWSTSDAATGLLYFLERPTQEPHGVLLHWPRGLAKKVWRRRAALRKSAACLRLSAASYTLLLQQHLSSEVSSLSGLTPAGCPRRPVMVRGLDQKRFGAASPEIALPAGRNYADPETFIVDFLRGVA